MEFGSVKSGVLLGILQHPSVVAQIQLLQDDQLIPMLLLMIGVAYAMRFGTDFMLAKVNETSLWRGLVDLCAITIEPFVSFLQMMIGILLGKTILQYTTQDMVGMILTTALGLVVDALMRYRIPSMRF
jgi:hypothetical protein